MWRKQGFALLLCFPALGLAESWSGHADIGYTATSGNSDTKNLNAAFGVVYKLVKWKHALELDVVRNEDSGAVSAERYGAEFQSNYALSDKSYLFGNIDWEKDEFGGVRERSSETIGYGRQILDKEKHKLAGELGIGPRQQEFQDGSKENDFIGRLNMDYDWLLSDTATFTQDFTVESGSENTFGESITGLKLKIVGNLAAKLTYTIRQNSDVPAGTEKRDTLTSVGVTYEFGS